MCLKEGAKDLGVLKGHDCQAVAEIAWVCPFLSLPVFVP